MAPYLYAPLSTEAKEVRLITLFKGSFTDKIEIRISTASFLADGNSPHPEFEALSYAWGSAIEKVHISVRTNHPEAALLAATLEITQNLAIVLPYLRLKDKDRCLWIDAICINQEDLGERSSQIQRMGDIYREAKCVLAWLGPEELSRTQHAVSILDFVSSKINVDWVAQEIQPKSDGLKEWADLGKFLPYNDGDWNAIQALCSQDWFERLWIRQEILLAKTANLLWGHSVISWESFRKAIFCIYNKRRHASLENTFWDRMTLLDGLVNNESSQSLAYAIYSSRHSKCHDPRDRIYALLELINEDKTEMDIIADYSKPVLQIYKKLAISYYNSFLDLAFLRHCDMGARECGTGLPSWAPDWRSLDAAAAILPEFSAHNNASASIDFDGDVLRALGLSISSVVLVTEIMTDSNRLYDDAALELQRCTQSHMPHCTDAQFKTQIRAISRVLIAEDFNSISENEGSTAMEKIYNSTRDSFNAVLVQDHSVCSYLDKAQWYCFRRSLISTSNGLLGLAPRSTQTGDIVCVLLGCANPLVLRPVAGKLNRFRIVGECFVDSIMRGAAFLGPLADRFETWLEPGWETRLDFGDCYGQEDENRVKTLEVMKIRNIGLDWFNIE